MKRGDKNAASVAVPSSSSDGAEMRDQEKYISTAKTDPANKKYFFSLSALSLSRLIRRPAAGMEGVGFPFK